MPSKKPPIELSELEEKVEKERVPGALTYVNEGKKRVNLGGSGGRSSTVQLLVTALAAVVISVFCIIQLAPSKTQFEEVRVAHNNLVPVVQAIPPTVTTVGTRLDNVINSLAGYATKGELSMLASSASVTMLSTLVGTVSSDMGTLKNDMSTLKSGLSTEGDRLTVANTSIAALEERIKVLEDKAVEETATTGGAPISYKITVFDEEFSASLVSGSSTVVGLKFSIQNTSTRDLQDLVFEIPIYLDYSGVSLQSASLSTSGGGNWHIKEAQSHTLIIRNTRMSIGASERKQIYFDITLVFNKPMDGGLECDDSDIELIGWDYK